MPKSLAETSNFGGEDSLQFLPFSQDDWCADPGRSFDDGKIDEHLLDDRFQESTRIWETSKIVSDSGELNSLLFSTASPGMPGRDSDSYSIITL